MFWFSKQVCDPTDMIRASPVALRERGFEAITTCRPEDYDKTERTMNRQSPPWSGVGYVAENTAMVAHDLVALLSSSSAVRKRLLQTKAGGDRAQRQALEAALPSTAAGYAIVEKLGLKMAGKEPWTRSDNGWGEAERAYIAAVDAAEAEACAKNDGDDESGCSEAAVGATARMASYGR